MTRLPIIAMVAFIALFSAATAANMIGAVTVEQLRMFLYYALPAFALFIALIYVLARKAARS